MIKTKKTKQLVNTKTKLVPGNLVTLKITALGPNNVGINEFTYGIPVLVPNAKLGDTVQVQILKIATPKKFVIAKLVKVLDTTSGKQENDATRSAKQQNLPFLTAGEMLDVTINKLGQNSTGIIELPNVYGNVNKLIVKNSRKSDPLNLNATDKVNVTVTRIKTNYAFGVVTASSSTKGATSLEEARQLDPVLFSTQPSEGVASHVRGLEASSLTGSTTFKTEPNLKGSKFTLVLPTKAKRYLKHLVFKLSSTYSSSPDLSVTYMSNKDTTQTLFKKGVASLESLVNKKVTLLPANTILFLKPRLGAKLGDKVQIQITKFFASSTKGATSLEEASPKYNVAIAKIVKLNPISSTQKKALVRASLRQMLKSGMHYGEKAIKCNARMKNYVWTRKKGQNVQNLNKPLIKKGRNIINLLKTRRCLNKALAQLAKYAAKGKTFLFVGTKKAAAGLVSRASLFSKKAFFVNTRWLGGMLTNWKTILKSISKIRPILKEKQMIIKDILEKRQSIKGRLIQKALLLRKKSKLMLKKGRQLLQMLRINQTPTGLTTDGRSPSLVGNNSSSKFLFVEKTNLLNSKRKELISKGILLLEKRQQLFLKRQELISQSQTLKSKATVLTNTYRQLLNNLTLSRKKLRELKSLLIISKELQVFKQNSKEQNQNLYMVSYNKFKTLNADFIVSNPPKEILNKMVSIIKGDLPQKGTVEPKALQALTIKPAQNDLNLKNNPGLTGHPTGAATQETLILSQLLSKFSLFVPTIKASINNLQTYVSTVLTSLNKVKTLLNTVKTKMLVYVTLKNKIVSELRQIKHTLQTERNIIRVLRRKLKQISAQKRLIKFLPKLRYLPTPAYKIEQTARFLMKKFVDPKMKYPMDSIYDEKLSRQSKKLAASRKKKWQRLERYLGGISNMTKLKEKQIRNNVAIIIGQQEEMNAVRECQKLGIKMFHIVDTNCNPGFADHFIPANDDARNSIKFILAKFLTRIRLAHKLKLKFKRKKIKK
jgi:ribosomal protein S2